MVSQHQSGVKTGDSILFNRATYGRHDTYVKKYTVPGLKDGLKKGSPQHRTSRQQQDKQNESVKTLFTDPLAEILADDQA